MSARSPVLSELPPEITTTLVGGQSNVVATIDADGRPNTTLMTWVVALDTRRIALCVDKRSRTYDNLLERPGIALELLNDGITWGVKGLATVAKEQMESTPFPCAIVVVSVEEARDHGHPTTHFRGPTYEYAGDKQHRRELEQRIYAELRSVA